MWLEDLKGQEKEMAQKFDLDYNAKSGEFSFGKKGDRNAGRPGEATFKHVHNAQTILYREGIEAMTQLYDDVVFDSVYLPKKLV